MDELTSLGLILLLALLAGHLVRAIRIPEVTGYLFAGVVLGPSVLGWLSEENLGALGILSEVALGLILFSIGSVFEFSLFRRIGRKVVQLTLVESIFAASIVTVGMLLLGQPWQISFLLGAVAIATAPASTLMVIRECDAAGPLTDNLLGVIAVNNVLCIATYGAVAATIDLASPGSSSFALTLYRSIFTFVWQLAGAAALGFLVGLLLAKWATHVTEGGEMLILLAGSILICVGISRVLGLSPLVASLAVGATMVNLTDRSRNLFATLAGTDPPFYAMFFVLAGAELDVSLIPAMGIMGVVYLVGRAAGKFFGARFAAKRLGLEPAVQRLLGFALLAQAGLAVGITFAINKRYPDLAPVITTVVLASVAVYEIVGPLCTRFALVRAGEAQMSKVPVGDPINML